MKVAEQDCCFWASYNKYDEHQEQKAKHVVHLTWPANGEITVHNTVIYVHIKNIHSLYVRSHLNLEDSN